MEAIEYMDFSWKEWSFVFAAGINTCIGNLLLKQSRRVSNDPDLISILLSPWVVGGLLFFGINVILFTKALEKLPVSAAYPVLAGLGFSLLAIFSGILFGERLNLSQWIAVSMILAGIIIMSRS